MEPSQWGVVPSITVGFHSHFVPPPVRACERLDILKKNENGRKTLTSQVKTFSCPKPVSRSGTDEGSSISSLIIAANAVVARANSVTPLRYRYAHDPPIKRPNCCHATRVGHCATNSSQYADKTVANSFESTGRQNARRNQNPVGVLWKWTRHCVAALLNPFIPTVASLSLKLNFTIMTLSLLHEIHNDRQDLLKRLIVLDQQEREILTGNTRLVDPVPLTFGKNVISWGNGKALSIGGKGYKLLKALYESNEMILDESAIGLLLCDNDMPNHKNFRETVRRTMEALERAKFPYRLLWVKSEERHERTGVLLKSGRPEVRRIQPVIIGVRLDARVASAKTSPDKRSA